MLILNSGGTLNKRYNKLKGILEVPFDNYAIEKVLKSVCSDYSLAGVVYKDSLEMTLEDRKMIASIIVESDDNKFLIIHGTDTMHITAEFLAEVFEDRVIILTGSMNPLEIDPIEATLNIGMSFGFLQANVESGVYICMSGHIQPYEKIVKNKNRGKFEIV